MQKNKKVWPLIAISYVLLCAPNATIIKITTDTIDPIMWCVIRAIPIVVVALPSMTRLIYLMRSKRAIGLVIAASSLWAVAIISYTVAIQLSQASYVSIIALLTPVLMVLLASLFDREVITRRAKAGVTLAAFGGVVLVLFPIALSQGSLQIYPLATVLAMTNCICFALAMIVTRRVNVKEKIPLLPTIGFSGLCVILLGVILISLTGKQFDMPINMHISVVGAVLYSGIGITLIARMMSVKLLEKIGSARMAVFEYVGTFLAILFPVVVLHEKLSITMVIGGGLILLGVYVTQHHKHTSHHLAWRHH